MKKDKISLLAILVSLTMSLSSCNSKETKDNLKEIKEVIKEYAIENNFLTNNSNNDGWSKSCISSDEAKELFYQDEKLNVDSYRTLYSASWKHGVDNCDGNIAIIIKDDKKYVVDANDFTKVYLTDYDTCKLFYDQNWDQEYGGPDSDGRVAQIVKDDKKYLVDSKNFSTVYLSDYYSYDWKDEVCTVIYSDGLVKKLKFKKSK